MPRATRTSAKKPKSRVYESKTVPKQQYFPHRRKTVRRPDGGHDVSEKKQITLTPGKVRRTDTIGDSDEDEDNLEIEEDWADSDVVSSRGSRHAEGVKSESVAINKKKKRTSDAMQPDTDEDDDPAPRTAKRTRNSTAPKPSRSTSCDSGSARNDSADSSSEREMVKATKRRQVRRQSTMTQILDGRLPDFDTPEPQYKPLRKGSRRSGSGKMSKDKKQQTLTQMVPGLGSFEILSDDDIGEENEGEATEERNDRSHSSAGSTTMSKPNSPKTPTRETSRQQARHISPSHNNANPHDIEQPEGDEGLPAMHIEDDDTEDEYQPTQFIEAPVLKRTRATRGTTKAQLPTPSPAQQHSAQRSARLRFGLLSTPEKRRIREIPSSQSPSESLLSTQNTPQKSGRSPLKRRSGNVLECAETPSKRKQVAFQLADQEDIPAPPTLRRFASTIQDSEDEDEEIIESDEEYEARNTTSNKTHTDPRKKGVSATGLAIGAETQAVLHSIDQACAATDNVDERTVRESSDDFEEPSVRFNSSNELGNSRKRSPEEQAAERIPGRINDKTSHSRLKHDLSKTASPTTPPPPSRQTRSKGLHEDDATTVLRQSPSDKQSGSLPPDNRREFQDTYPSSPLIFIGDSSDEEQEELSLTPSVITNTHTRQTSPSPLPKTPQAAKSPRIIVPVSPSPLRPRTKPGELEEEEEEENEEESQLSTLHSAAAEQQLHSEYATYSQFRPPGPPASSMQVAHDTRFSYQDTPRPPTWTKSTQQQHSPSTHYSHHNNNNIHSDISQATTIDEPTQDLPPVIVHSTPEKAVKTKRSIKQEQPEPEPEPEPELELEPAAAAVVVESSSPPQPPPLVIPSSFPTPSKHTQYRALFPSSPLAPEIETQYYNPGADEDNKSPLLYTATATAPTMMLSRGDGVGASGAGKGYTQWLAHGHHQLSGEDDEDGENLDLHLGHHHGYNHLDGTVDADEEEEMMSMLERRVKREEEIYEGEEEEENWEDFSIPGLPPRIDFADVGRDDGEASEMEL